MFSYLCNTFSYFSSYVLVFGCAGLYFGRAGAISGCTGAGFGRTGHMIERSAVPLSSEMREAGIHPKQRRGEKLAYIPSSAEERESAGIQPDHHREERFSSATYLGELKPRVFAYSAVSGLPWGAKISCVPRIFELGPYGSVWADTCTESIPWALECLWDASWTPNSPNQNRNPGFSGFRGSGC